MAEYTFDGEYRFTADSERRTITGVVAPWGVVGKHKNGDRWRFARGSLKFAAAKFVRFDEEHHSGLTFGRALSATETDEGLVMTFAVDPGAHGDRMLAEAQSGKKVGLSASVEADEDDIVPDSTDPSVRVFNLAHLLRVGLVRNPAFTGSRLISVVASQEGKEGSSMTDATAVATPEPADEQSVELTNENKPVADMSNGTVANVQLSANQRPTVDPTRNYNVAVKEALPYKFSYTSGRYVFDRGPNGYDFSSDVFDIVSGRGSRGAEDRVNGLISAAFDIDRADTAVLNPNTYRPDMWQPQMDYVTPLWDMINSGSTDGTAFDVPKFSSASGMVGPATEGTEPAAGAMAVTSQTITPTQVWGKVEITRQAARRGGRPELSGILWDQMLREYYEDREAAVATFLNTLTAAADIALTGTPASSPDNDDDRVTANDLEMAIASLQYVRGGNRFRAFAVHIDLFKVLARVKDASGRPLYPMINPQNANGTSANLFGSLNVAGTTVVPSWALGATGTASANSWLFDPAKVRGWASAPERLDWNFGATVQTANIPQLAHVTIGIYGDIALANLDINGVRQVTFDPSV